MSPNSVTHLSEQVLPMSPNTCYLSLRSIHLPHQGGGDLSSHRQADFGPLDRFGPLHFLQGAAVFDRHHLDEFR